MERQMKKCRQITPEKEKVQVIYYLCRNHHLEHPHFIEVPLSSPRGLYLKDVIDRLSLVRGRGMTAKYAWSCKRSYKNGFVWHDLCKDDLIHPVHGKEYILKGSEFFQESHPDHGHPSNVKQNAKQLQQPTLSIVDRETKSCLEGEFSPPHKCSGSSALPLQYRDGTNLSRCTSKNLTEYNVYKGIGGADASTQTEEIVGRPRVSRKCKENKQNQTLKAKENSQPCGEGVSPPLSISKTSSTCRKTESLESLMKAESNRMNSFRILDEGKTDTPSSANCKTVNVLMQLISCGSISENDHLFGFIPSYKPRLSSSKILSPLSSNLEMLGEAKYASEIPRLMDSTVEEKEYFSGSLVETKTHNSEWHGSNAIKRSSSYNADRTCKLHDPIGEDITEPSSTHSKCIPHSIKASLSKQLRRETMRPPASQGRRNSSADVDASQLVPLDVSIDSSKRSTSSVKLSPQIQESFREEEKVITIEES